MITDQVIFGFVAGGRNGLSRRSVYFASGPLGGTLFISAAASRGKSNLPSRPRTSQDTSGSSHGGGGNARDAVDGG